MNKNTEIRDDPKLIAFEPNSRTKIESWLTYFDDICEKEKKDLEWNFKSFAQYLKGEVQESMTA